MPKITDNTSKSIIFLGGIYYGEDEESYNEAVKEGEERFNKEVKNLNTGFSFFLSPCLN